MKGASPSPEKLLVYFNFYTPLPLGPRLFWSGYQVALKEILSTLGPPEKAPDKAPGEESDETPKLENANQRFAISLISDQLGWYLAGCLLRTSGPGGCL